MTKELEYEFNNFANLLHKDCMNLMEVLKKQSEDNKPILYLGKHYEKVILPYEEYQKMCNRLEAIDNAEPSEALNELNRIENNIIYLLSDCDTNDEVEQCLKDTKAKISNIKQALLKAQEPKKYVDELKLVEKKLQALDTIKKFIWVEDGKLKCGRYGDIEIELEEEDFESKDELDLLKEVLGC